MNRKRYLLAAGALLLAAGAAIPPAGAQTRREQMWSSYDPTEVNGAQGGRRLPTLVAGNPFAVPQQEVVDAVARAMTGGQPMDQSVAVKAPMRVMMLFNATTVTGYRICDRSKPVAVADLGPRGGSVDLVATYCRGDSPQTQVVASLNGVSGPDDPRFADMIKQVTLSLFPFRNPDLNGDNFPD